MTMKRAFLGTVLLAAWCAGFETSGAAQDPQPEPTLKTELKKGEAVIWHLRHSGVAVKTANYLLVFDYFKDWRGEDPKGTIDKGIITSGQIKDLEVVVLVTHAHGDHFNPAVCGWADEVDRIHYVFTETTLQMARKADKEKVTVVAPDGNYTLKTAGSGKSKVVVRTVRSTDMGVAYWVEVDGLTILHTGDLALWGWDEKNYENARAAYMKEIDKLAALKKKLDIGFFCADIRMKGKGALSGAPLAVAALKPAFAMAIHNHDDNAKGAEALGEAVKKSSPDTAVAPVRKRGQAFQYRAASRKKK